MNDILRSIRSFFYFVIIIMAVIFIFKVAYNLSHIKHNILYATRSDLKEITGIGDTLSNQIYDYVQKHSIHSIKELEGHVEGLGQKRIKELEEIYK